MQAVTSALLEVEAGGSQIQGLSRVQSEVKTRLGDILRLCHLVVICSTACLMEVYVWLEPSREALDSESYIHKEA